IVADNLRRIRHITEDQKPSRISNNDLYSFYVNSDGSIRENFTPGEDIRDPNIHFFHIESNKTNHFVFDSIRENLPDQVRTVLYSTFAAMNKELEAKKSAGDKAITSTGGIDFTPDKMNLQVQNIGGKIKVTVDPAMLAQLQNTPGFSPYVVSVEPLNDLRGFLSQQATPLKSAAVS
ncbi:MAG: hypothetical protein HQL15_06900, partial [Candidatus Omnitrophica bacterium]|nr:hypothetical protein [Candidatus Omnitrophota bacterium]